MVLAHQSNKLDKGSLQISIGNVIRNSIRV